MEDDKNTIPYIITMYGTLNTEATDFQSKKEELLQTNIQYLINKADSKFIEVNETEYEKNEEAKNVCR